MKKYDYTRHYNKWHPDTSEHIAYMRRYSYRRVRQWLDGMQTSPVLDIGCGKGYMIGALQQEGFSAVLGIDSDEGQVQSAQKQGLSVSLVDNTIEWLQKRERHFKVILCFDVIEHIPIAQQVDFVTAIYRALGENGMLLCTVPNANSTFAARQRYIDYTHYTAFTEPSLDFLLYHGGFKDISVVADEIKPRMPWIPRIGLGWWYLQRIFHFARRIQLMSEIGYKQGRGTPLSLNLLGVARK